MLLGHVHQCLLKAEESGQTASAAPPANWEDNCCPACRYPNNPVLRVLTPSDTCRPLDIYPVKMTQEAIQVDIADASTTRSYASTRGGSDTSIDKNNVYALQPKSYLQGTEAPGTPAAGSRACLHLVVWNTGVVLACKPPLRELKMA